MKIAMLGQDFQYEYAPAKPGIAYVKPNGTGTVSGYRNGDYSLLGAQEISEQEWTAVNSYWQKQLDKGREISFEQARNEFLDSIGSGVSKGESVVNAVTKILGSINEAAVLWYQGLQAGTGKTVVTSKDVNSGLMGYVPWLIGGGVGLLALMILMQGRRR